MPSSHPTIRALIIGSSVSGLATAIAFSRASHRAIVFEARSEVAPAVTGFSRLAPNLTKIIYQWGYEERLRKIAHPATAMECLHLYTGEYLGRHVWDEELIRDAQGDILYATYGDLLRLLHAIARESGAEIHYGQRVVGIDLETRTLRLEDGETISGDIIVGADGECGISRSLFKFEENPGPPPIAPYDVYFSTVPKEKIMADPETAPLCDGDDAQKSGVNKIWHGDRIAVQIFPLINSEYALLIYAPTSGGQPTGWMEQGQKEQMSRVVGQAESRVRKLAEWGREPQVVTFHYTPPPCDWWHPDGNLVLVGDAAQPSLPGVPHEPASSFEGGVTLGRLFSYLRRYEQIGDLLEAYEELRRPRDIKGRLKAIEDFQFISYPGELGELRNRTLRVKRDAGRNLFDIEMPVGSDQSSDGWKEWHDIVDLFAYNAEDAADDWWRKQGILAESSKGLHVQPESLSLQVTVCQDINEH